MNELGTALAWLSVQVGLILLPAFSLQIWASRRGPAAGAWVAATSLGLVLALSVLTWCVDSGDVGRRVSRKEPPPSTVAVASPTEKPRDASEPSDNPLAGLSLAEAVAIWDRLGRGASEPAEWCRPWGGMLAFTALLGTAVGLIRLTVGLVAVHACRRRGTIVDDSSTRGLLDELRPALGCSRDVELREVDDLGVPAAAGWLRPVILLPVDWRSWTDAERRAVLAHELAHIVRGDYATGLLARLTVSLHWFHPFVRITAGRMALQQEQAADALAARFAGGTASYLAALATIALKQDGPSPGWAARGFLAGRGTLVRRIMMLQNRIDSHSREQTLSKTGRWGATAALIALTIAVATLKGPARADGQTPPVADVAKEARTPIAPPYISQDKCGLVAIRPEALAAPLMIRHIVMEATAWATLNTARELQVDPSAPGFQNIDLEDVEWATVGLHLGQSRDDQGAAWHRLELMGLTVRTRKSLDWTAFLRQWRVETTEVQEAGQSFHRISGWWKEHIGGDPCVLVLDDRTVVLDEESSIRAALRGESPTPDYLRGPTWEQASQGSLAVAIGNGDGEFTKQYDLGRPDDAAVLAFFQGVKDWILSVDDAEGLGIRAVVSANDSSVIPNLARGVDDLLVQLRATANVLGPRPGTASSNQTFNILSNLLSNARVDRFDESLTVHSQTLGSLSDLTDPLEAQARTVENEMQEADARRRR